MTVMPLHQPGCPFCTDGSVPSVEDLHRLPVTVDVPTAGRFFGLRADASYAAVRRDDFPVPVLTVGRRLVVTRHSLITLLDPDGTGRPQ